MSRGLGVDKVDVSYLTDILAKNESGPALDLSVPAFFRRICPKINFPVAQLRQYKEALLERLENVPAVNAKIVQRWGRPYDWGVARSPRLYCWRSGGNGRWKISGLTRQIRPSFWRTPCAWFYGVGSSRRMPERSGKSCEKPRGRKSKTNCSGWMSGAKNWRPTLFFVLPLIN